MAKGSGNIRVRSGRLSTMGTPGVKKLRGVRQFSGLPNGAPPYQPIEALRPMIKDMVAAGMPRDRIANLIINPATGEPISVSTLIKYYKRELDTGLDEANLAMSRSVFKQGIGVEGVPNPKYGKRDPKTKLIDRRKWLVEPVAPQPSMSIWWEKTRAGKKEGMVHEHIGADGQPLVQQQVVIVLPGNGREYSNTPILDLIREGGTPTHGTGPGKGNGSNGHQR